MAREKFQLYQRIDAKGRKKWLARFWSAEEGRYGQTLTLHAANKPEAHAEAEKRQKEELPSKANPLLVDFLNDFWGASGEYAKLKKLRGKALSPRYLALCRSAVRLYIQPYKPFEKMRVGDLLPVNVERWQSWCADQGIGARSANIALQCLRTAVRRRAKGRREPDPLPGLMKAEELRTERGVLILKEVQAIIARPQGTTEHDRVTVLLALLAGLRLGEVRGLRWEDIDLEAGILKVERSISADEKEPRAPKWGSMGELPISDPLAEELRALQAKTKDESGYVLGIGGAPIGTTGLRGAFRRVLDAIGIDAEARKARNLSFHGLRHSFVSMGRLSGIPDFIMQKMARHKTAAMTIQVYSHGGVIDFADARQRLTDSVKAKVKAKKAR